MSTLQNYKKSPQSVPLIMTLKIEDDEDACSEMSNTISLVKKHEIIPLMKKKKGGYVCKLPKDNPNRDSIKLQDIKNFIQNLN